MDTVAIIDFETTGMRAGQDRIIEVGAVLWRNGAVVGTFAELMHPGFPIPPFISHLTGITSAMVRHCPPPQEVMPRLRAFLGDHVCVAHNAAFDQRFFTAEMALANESHHRPFLCSVLLSRRLVPTAPSHRLGDLAHHLGLTMPPGMRAHRALADALVTGALWQHLLTTLTRELPGQTPDQALLEQLLKVPKAKVGAFLSERRTPRLAS